MHWKPQLKYCFSQISDRATWAGAMHVIGRDANNYIHNCTNSLADFALLYKAEPANFGHSRETHRAEGKV